MPGNMPRPARRVGIMGGTFNPIHNGHLRAAEEIAESLALEQIYFVPSASPPHKQPEPVLDYWRRLEMLKLAVSERPGFWASDLESRLSFPSYTANTLRAFKEMWGPATEIFFLVGLDAFLSIASWLDYRELFRLASFVVFERAGTDMDGAAGGFAEFLEKVIAPAPRFDAELNAYVSPDCRPVYHRPGCRLEISSSDLRARLESGASVRYLVPEAVRIYIEQNGLYRS